MKLRSKKTLFVMLALFGAVAVSEGLLQILATCSPRVDALLAPSWRHVATPTTPLYVSDPVVGHRPNPACRDHDRRGFRNARVPGEAAVVVLGDSQTYGVNVARELAWPQQLAELSGRGAYNMGFGGYGPVHSLLLLPEALELKPRLVVVALYAGNDLVDCYRFVYPEDRLPALRSQDPTILAQIAAAAATEPMMERIARVTRSMRGTPTAPPRRAEQPCFSLRQAVSEHCKLYGLLRAAKESLRPRAAVAQSADAAWTAARKHAAAHADHCRVFEHERLRTILTPGYRLCALDFDDPRIVEGQRIALEAIRQIRDEAHAAGGKVMVLLIPTKEYVFHDVVLEAGDEPDEDQMRLAANEAALWNSAQQFLDAEGIPWIDPLPRLRAMLAVGTQPYPVSNDGHPNAAGYRTIAETVHAAITQTGGLD